MYILVCVYTYHVGAKCYFRKPPNALQITVFAVQMVCEDTVFVW